MASPARPFYSKWVWKDWLAKVQDLNTSEYVAYHRLLTYAATSSPDLCSIPGDDLRLSRITGLGMRLWNRSRRRVMGFFEGPHLMRDGTQKWVSSRLRWDAGEWFHLVENQRRAACIRHSKTPPMLEVRSKKSEESKKKEEAPASRRRSARIPDRELSHQTQAEMALRFKLPLETVALLSEKILLEFDARGYRSAKSALITWCKREATTNGGVVEADRDDGMDENTRRILRMVDQLEGK